MSWPHCRGSSCFCKGMWEIWGGGVPEQEKTKTMMKTKCSIDEGAPVARANGDRMIVERWTGF